MIRRIVRALGNRLAGILARRGMVGDQQGTASVSAMGRELRIPVLRVPGCEGLGSENLRPLHEGNLTRCFRAALAARSGVFLDLGANVGQTLLRVLALDPGRRYVGFEPNVHCCFYLEQLIAANGLDRHTVLPIGLTNRARVARLHLADHRTQLGSAVEGFRPASFYSHQRGIFLAEGDKVIEDLGLENVGIVKVDVEGGELEVFEGLGRTLSAHRPLLFFEVLPHYLVANGQPLDPETAAFREARERRLEQWLADHGYVVYRIDADGTPNRIESFDPGTDPDLSRSNYLAMTRGDEAGLLAGIDEDLRS